MEAGLFFYNIAVMAAYVFCAVIFHLFHRRCGSKVYRYISWVFLLFVLDNLIYYMVEFLPSFSFYYDNCVYFRAISSNLMSFLIIFSYRLVLLAALTETITKIEKVVWIFVLVLQITVPLFFPGCNYVQGLSSLMHILAIAIFIRSLYKKWTSMGEVTSPVEIKKHDVQISDGVLIVSLILQVMFAVENLRMLILLNTNSRSVTIELIGFFYTVLAVRFIIRKLTQELMPVAAASNVSDADTVFLAFCDQYELTSRERDVASLLSEGLSNQEIAQKLYISEGTVKTHVHNIYKKLGINTRLRFSSKLSAFIMEQA